MGILMNDQITKMLYIFIHIHNYMAPVKYEPNSALPMHYLFEKREWPK